MKTHCSSEKLEKAKLSSIALPGHFTVEEITVSYLIQDSPVDL